MKWGNGECWGGVGIDGGKWNVKRWVDDVLTLRAAPCALLSQSRPYHSPRGGLINRRIGFTLSCGAPLYSTAVKSVKWPWHHHTFDAVPAATPVTRARTQPCRDYIRHPASKQLDYRRAPPRPADLLPHLTSTHLHSTPPHSTHSLTLTHSPNFIHSISSTFPFSIQAFPIFCVNWNNLK